MARPRSNTTRHLPPYIHEKHNAFYFVRDNKWIRVGTTMAAVHNALAKMFTGKEDEMFSPFLRKPFKKAVEAGLIPPSLITLAGTWGTVTDQGDLTYLNLVHLTEIDGTSADDLTRGEIDGRHAVAFA